ncbi:MAG: YfhO family protein [Oligoflexia bacterium]|nr:YfhO family protein [Oligoflexia bacterium]
MHKRIKFNHQQILLTFILLAMSIYVYRAFIFDHFLLAYLDCGIDSYHETIPTIALISDYIRSDGFPRWTFNIGLGQNIWGYYVTDIFHWPLFLIKKELAAYYLVYIQIIKILLAGNLFYLYLRLFKIKKYAAVLAAITFAFSAPMILRSQWPFFINMPIYLILLLYSFELFFLRGKKWPLLLSIFYIAINDTFILILYSFLLLFYASSRLYNSFWRYSFNLIKIYIAAIILSSAIFIPQLYSLLSSTRVSGDLSQSSKFIVYSIFNIGSFLEIATPFLRLFSNDILGTSTFSYKGYSNYMEAPAFYSGLLTLILIPQIFVFRSTSIFRSKYLGLLLLCLLYVLFPYFRYVSNFFAGDYYRYTTWINIILIFIAFEALSLIEVHKYLSKKVLLLTVTFLITFLLIAKFYSPSLSAIINTKVLYYDIGILFLYALLLFFFTKKLKYFVFLLMIFELTRFADITVNKNRHRLHRDTYEKSDQSYLDYTKEALKYINSIDKGFFRVEKNFHSGSLNDSFFQNYKGVKSYFSFNEDSYLSFRAALKESLGPNGVVLDSFKNFALNDFVGVKYYLSLDTVDKKLLALNKQFQFVKQIGNIHIYLNKNALPIAFTYPINNFILESDFLKLTPEKRVELLNSKYVIAENMIKSSTDNQNQLQPLSISSYDNNQIVGKIKIAGAKAKSESENEKMLFFSIPYNKGWQIEVNGRCEVIYKITFGFMGVKLKNGEGDSDTGGEYNIRLFFNPYPFSMLSK